MKFEQPYTARYFRVYPKTKYREYCMQMEFYGCTPGKGKDPIRSTLYKYIFSYTAYKKVHKQPPEVFYKKGVLKKGVFIKKALWHRCFPVNFVKCLRTPFLPNTSGRLLLKTEIQIIQ